jgi:hypothetical protein
MVMVVAGWVVLDLPVVARMAVEEATVVGLAMVVG